MNSRGLVLHKKGSTVLTNGSGVAVLGTVYTERQHQCDEANDIALITDPQTKFGAR